MKLNKIAMIFGLGLLALTQVGCGRTVQPGETGILIKTLGSGAGVSPKPLQMGWNMTGIGEHIITYPIIEKYYQYSKSDSEGKAGDTSIAFSDKNGITTDGDVNIKVNVVPAMAPKLYQMYKLDFIDLLDGPIRNDVRTAITDESEKLTVDQLPGDGRHIVIQNALAIVQKKWAPQGVNITDLQWLGNLRYPDVMVAAITARTKADQEVAAAEAQERVAEAQAKTKVAIAQGDADATRIRGQALQANPQVLRQLELERWNGALPEYYGSSNIPFILNKQ